MCDNEFKEWTWKRDNFVKAHIYYVVLLFSGIIIIPENNNTTCFTMKIDLRKYETAFPQWSASKFLFSAVGFLPPLFIQYSQKPLLVTGYP